MKLSLINIKHYKKLIKKAETWKFTFLNFEIFVFFHKNVLKC